MNQDLRQTAIEIVRRLQEAGHQAYWVGGCVRNALLGLNIDDYDIATSAKPEEVCAVFPKAGLVGAHFGVVLVHEGDHDFEVATFRKEGRYVDHRHPQEVSFGTMEEDARRRDFTVNALYYDPLADHTIDLVHGRADLDSRILRAIGNPAERFEEDALRLMRAVRFAARYELTIEHETESAIRDRAALIQHISMERIRDELLRILTGPHRGRGLRTLSDLGLLVHFLPEVEAMHGVRQPPRFHPEGDVFEHTVLALEALEEPTPTLAMAALLHDVGKPPTYEEAEDRIRFHEHSTVGAEMADAICLRLRLPNRDREAVVQMVRRHMTFMDVHRMKNAKLKRFMAAPTFAEDLQLHRADCLACHGKTENLDYIEEKRREFQEESENMLPPPIISGNELIALGLKPGPIFKEILERLQDMQMENEIQSPEEALEWVREHYISGG